MTNTSSTISGASPVFEGAELILGLVAPVGTNFNLFQNPLERCLSEYRYRPNVIRVSELMGNLGLAPHEEVSGSTKHDRLSGAMHAGNQLRLSSKRGEILALAAAHKIHSTRPEEANDQTVERRIDIVRSLKVDVV